MIPNRDSHCHLEGSIYPRTFERIARMIADRGTPLPAMPVYRLPSNFEEFLFEFRKAYPLFRYLETYTLVLDELLNVLTAGGIMAVDIHVNLALIKTFRHGVNRVFDTLWTTASAHHKTDGMETRFIADLPWQFSSALFYPFIDDPGYFQERGVCGFSMGGDENLAQPTLFEKVMQDGADKGYEIQCHCGEIPSDHVVRDVVNRFPVNRLIHAVSAAQAPDLLERISKKGIGIDVCFTSNKILLDLAYEKHPWRLFAHHGIRLSFGSDDPAIFMTTPDKELDLSRRLVETDALC